MAQKYPVIRNRSRQMCKRWIDFNLAFTRTELREVRLLVTEHEQRISMLFMPKQTKKDT